MGHLRFSRERARGWHDGALAPSATGQFRTDGRYELKIPYRDYRELVREYFRKERRWGGVAGSNASGGMRAMTKRCREVFG